MYNFVLCFVALGVFGTSVFASNPTYIQGVRVQKDSYVRPYYRTVPDPDFQTVGDKKDKPQLSKPASAAQSDKPHQSVRKSPDHTTK